MLRRSKKMTVSLLCALGLAAGGGIVAYAGSSGTAYPHFPPYRGEIAVVSGTHTSPRTDVTLYGNINEAYCTVIWGRTSVTGAFVVPYEHTVAVKNNAPQGNTIVLRMGNDYVSPYTYNATVKYDL